jgi:hypothetical protein
MASGERGLRNSRTQELKKNALNPSICSVFKSKARRFAYGISHPELQTRAPNSKLRTVSLRRKDQPEESTSVKKGPQFPRNCDASISQLSAVATCALPATNPNGRLVPSVGTGEKMATACFLRPNVTVIDSPLRTASKASEFGVHHGDRPRRAANGELRAAWRTQAVEHSSTQEVRPN